MKNILGTLLLVVLIFLPGQAFPDTISLQNPTYSDFATITVTVTEGYYLHQPPTPEEYSNPAHATVSASVLSGAFTFPNGFGCTFGLNSIIPGAGPVEVTPSTPIFQPLNYWLQFPFRLGEWLENITYDGGPAGVAFDASTFYDHSSYEGGASVSFAGQVQGNLYSEIIFNGGIREVGIGFEVETYKYKVIPTPVPSTLLLLGSSLLGLAGLRRFRKG